MFWFLSIGLEGLTAAVLLAPVFLVLDRVRFRNPKRSFLLFLFGCYLACVYFVVGLPGVTYLQYLRFAPRLNLIPLIGMGEDLKNTILNVVLFVPLGFMLPLLWRRYRTVWAASRTGFLLSAAIELIQCFTGRATDINDLITNTLGAFLGACLAAALLRGKDRILGEASAGEMPAVFAAVTGIMFFLQPWITGWLWSRIFR